MIPKNKNKSNKNNQGVFLELLVAAKNVFLLPTYTNENSIGALMSNWLHRNWCHWTINNWLYIVWNRFIVALSWLAYTIDSKLSNIGAVVRFWGRTLVFCSMSCRRRTVNDKFCPITGIAGIRDGPIFNTRKTGSVSLGWFFWETFDE